MANVMSLKKLKNNTSRNGFDLSKRNIFSAKVGELLPVYCKEVIPGDKFNINVKSFTRTMPVNTAAYTRIKEYYDWFFVPTNLLWNKFNTFVTQMTDNNQHAVSPSADSILSSQHPFFTVNQLHTYWNTLRGNVSNNAAKNIFGFERYQLTAKLLEYLGYGDMSSYGTDPNHIANNAALNPFPLLAYQKIYSDYYRDSQWERAFAPSFNVDYIQGDNDLNIPVSDIPWYTGPTPTTPMWNMFDLRYANWNKDLIMGVKPTSQFGSAASVDLSSILNTNDSEEVNTDYFMTIFTNAPAGDLPLTQSAIYPNLRYLGSAGANKTYFDGKGLNNLAKSMGLTIDKLKSAFTILALRQAEALQKWKEITLSQQQDYKTQIEAHFGVSLSDAYSERCHYVDGFSDVIDINEVVNTNLVSGDTLNAADIAGKGIGVNDGYTSFSSDVHGYLMCIYHAVPLLDYSLGTGIQRQNLKTQVTDYAIPELDKTGMVQLPFITLSNYKRTRNIEFLGYAPRYYDYKTDIDEVHGSLRNKQSDWVAPVDDEYLNAYFASRNYSDISYDFFKINPAILDSIFIASAAADSGTNSDQLLTNCMFDVKAVRNLDYDGLPY